MQTKPESDYLTVTSITASSTMGHSRLNILCNPDPDSANTSVTAFSYVPA